MKTFYSADTVYIPERDPEAKTIWVIEEVDGNVAKLYHPLKGTQEISVDEIEHSPF
jgi:hypothetical protein